MRPTLTFAPPCLFTHRGHRSAPPPRDYQRAPPPQRDRSRSRDRYRNDDAGRDAGYRRDDLPPRDSGDRPRSDSGAGAGAAPADLPPRDRDFPAEAERSDAPPSDLPPQ